MLFKASKRNMHFKVTEQAAQVLARFAEQNHITSTEALSRAIGLLDLADRNQEKGVILGLVKEEKEEKTGNTKLKAVDRVYGVFGAQ